MTYAPASLTALSTYWKAQGGVPLGIVGNKAHTSGYHCGADRIFDGSGPGLGWNDYSVQTARDRKGLTNAASAIDLGRLDGTLKGLQTFSRWLVSACLAHAGGYEDVREIIYSPDGNAVQRYSGIDGKIHTGPGNGDSSHRTHTHISYFRDARRRGKVALFEPYFAVPPDSSTGDDVQTFLVPEQRTYVTLPKGTKLYVNSSLAADDKTIILDPGREFVLVGNYNDAIDIVAYEAPEPDPGPRSWAMFVKGSDRTGKRVETPHTAVELEAAAHAGYAEAKSKAVAIAKEAAARTAAI